MYTVEKGIPIPESTRKGRDEKYGFSTLTENGDSFFIPSDGSDNQLKKVQHAAYSAEKRLSKGGTNVRFVVRNFDQLAEGGATESGIRVWRKDNQ